MKTGGAQWMSEGGGAQWKMLQKEEGRSTWLVMEAW